MNPTQAASAAVTGLFVPGDRPERFAKAVASGADIVIIDWEDAVADEAKRVARESTIAALSGGELAAVVRINGATTPDFEAELRDLAALERRPGVGLLGVMLPKAEHVEQVEYVRAHLPSDVALIPLIESAAGVLCARELARAEGVTRLAFGALDYALDIGTDDSNDVLSYARSSLVLASRAAGLAAPLDSPTLEIADASVVATAATYARRFGFGGKLCIHPTQIATVARAFLPDESMVEWARAVIAATDASPGEGAIRVNGAMVDRPVIDKAKEILRRMASAE